MSPAQDRGVSTEQLRQVGLAWDGGARREARARFAAALEADPGMRQQTIARGRQRPGWEQLRPDEAMDAMIQAGTDLDRALEHRANGQAPASAVENASRAWQDHTATAAAVLDRHGMLPAREVDQQPPEVRGVDLDQAGPSQRHEADVRDALEESQRVNTISAGTAGGEGEAAAARASSLRAADSLSAARTTQASPRAGSTGLRAGGGSAHQRAAAQEVIAARERALTNDRGEEIPATTEQLRQREERRDYPTLEQRTEQAGPTLRR